VSIKSFLRNLFPPELDLEGRVEQSMPRYREHSTQELKDLLRSCDYLALPGEAPDRPGMTDNPTVQRLLTADDAAAFHALADDWGAVLNALRAAEHDSGFTGRPLLMDYDLHLSCIVRALAERA
jgi:hypothetical protein